ncbi:flagellar basal body-associated FliL family protein [Puniceicoccaceae bacterium K14]|nr:flagellar basal body-associated FliL family protein [Puniceicoccaceae bacterium K14]
MADENEAAEAAPAEAKPAGGGGGGGMMPALLIIVLMPVVSFAMFKFLFIPMIKAEIPEPGEDALHDIKPEDINVEHASGDLEYKVDLDPVTANLRGTAQTRFIRVAAVLRSADPELTDVVESNKGRIKEVIGSVIGSKTLADLEKPEIRNVMRNQMKQGFEHVLKKPIIEEIVFAEFVVQ